MNFFSGLLTTLFERTSELLPGQFGSGNDLNALSKELLSAKGEVSGVAIAERILNLYRQGDDAEKLSFFTYLVDEMDFDITAVRESLDAYAANQQAEDYNAFMRLAEPVRRQFFRRLNEAPGATHALVTMRRDLLALMKTHPELAVIDIDLKALFISWFNRGFLVLRPINWKSPAHILEKIIAYEAVHEISSWDDLRRRLAPADRRCFAFFHPAMPEEPLIFVEVALTNLLPKSIQKILADDRDIIIEDEMDYAVFYSISNCQQGLAGISFGNSLIKTVVGELNQDLPQLKHFITLSPLPGFSRWLAGQHIRASDGTTRDAVGYLDDNKTEGRALAAYYLTRARRESGQPYDPVSRFHLGNGASVFDIHDAADLSPRGQQQSFGLMVNYLYEKDKLVHNHEGFVHNSKITASRKINDLASKVADRLVADHNG